MSKKLSFKEYLLENPLPSDWDEAIYNDHIPFSKRIAYAKQRAAKMGAGSSRVAFQIPYQGRPTILKIAKNTKGIAQNRAEVDLLDDFYLKDLGIIIPLIDYDEKNSSPTWIHTELATKAKSSDFIKEFGGTVDQLVRYAQNRKNHRDDLNKGSPISEENEAVSCFMQFVGNYDHIPLGDFSRLANWGKYQGKLVIIDVGLNKDVFDNYYSR